MSLGESLPSLSYAAKYGTNKIPFHGGNSALIAVDVLVAAAAFFMGVMADVSFAI